MIINDCEKRPWKLREEELRQIEIEIYFGLEKLKSFENPFSRKFTNLDINIDRLIQLLPDNNKEFYFDKRAEVYDIFNPIIDAKKKAIPILSSRKDRRQYLVTKN